MDLDSVHFVVVDVETTGLDPSKGHRVVEIGAIRTSGGREVSRFHSLVNPQRAVDPGAYQQHGIGDAELKDAPLFPAIATDFRRALAGAVMVAQNAPFDLGFLNSEFAHAGLGKINIPVLDTIPLARRVRPGLRSYSLDNLALAFRLSIASTTPGSQLGRHRSLGDCELTLQVFLECLKSMRQRGEVRTLEDLLSRGAVK